jgi:hypothetical protein
VRAKSDPDGKSVTVGKPMSSAWREEMLTRAQELGDLASSFVDGDERCRITAHLERVHQAAEGKRADGGRERHRRWHALNGSSFERALGNIDAAEVHLLRRAPEFVIPALPSIQAHVDRYLTKEDPRRQAVDRIARNHTERFLRERESRSETVHVAARFERDRRPGRRRRHEPRDASPPEEPDRLVRDELEILLSAQHAANSQRRRDLNRLRNFRNLLLVGSIVLLVFAITLGLIGSISPKTIPLCFVPETAQETKVVCPGQETTPDNPKFDRDKVIAQTVRGRDVWLVELLGLLGAALTGAAALRSLGSNSTPFLVPATLVLFKLPTGAVTAVIGLLLMRAGFVPGLSALDSPAQILGWAVVFGIAQQLVTQIADGQAAGLLQNVKGRGAAGDRPLTGQQSA